MININCYLPPNIQLWTLTVLEIPVAELSITGKGIENTGTGIKKKKVGEAVKHANEEVNKEKMYD